jgi:hypothetical protein
VVLGYNGLSDAAAAADTVPAETAPVPVPGRMVGAAYVEFNQSGLADMAMGAPVPADAMPAVPVPRTGEGIMVSVVTVMLVKLTVVDVVLEAAVMFATGAAGTPVLSGIGAVGKKPVMIAGVRGGPEEVEFRGYGGRIGVREAESAGPVEKSRLVALMAVDRSPTGRIDIILLSELEVVKEANAEDVGVGVSDVMSAAVVIGGPGGSTADGVGVTYTVVVTVESPAPSPSLSPPKS